MKEISRYVINIPASTMYVKILGDKPKLKHRDGNVGILKNDTRPTRKFERKSAYLPLRDIKKGRT